MKYLSYYSTLLIGLCVVCAPSCDDPIFHKGINAARTIIHDQTEEYFRYPSFKEFVETSGLSENINNGEIVKLVPIVESGFVKTFEYTIKPIIHPIFSNEPTRGDDVDSFFSTIQPAWNEMDSGKEDKNGSAIFKAIVEEANRMHSLEADIKQMYIITDGMENSALASFYDSRTFEMIECLSDTLIRQFITKYPLSDLTGIDMYFMYTPLDRSDGERYEVVFAFYKKLFEEYGANVFYTSVMKPVRS